MAFTVQDLLDLPVLCDARPQVVCGSDLDRRPVRWVHTSEIYGISPLLKGGEVLLTTGLGLVGAGAAAIGGYVHALASQGVAAVFLELGRTFTAPPPELVAAAREHDLPLVLLHGVVPFIEVTEVVHPLLLSDEVELLRRLERATAALHEALADGVGGPELMCLVSELCGAPTGLYAADGSLLLGTDVRSTATSSEELLEVDVGRTPWGLLVVGGTATSAPRRLAELCADVLDLRIGPAGHPGRQTGAGADLVLALASGQHLTSSDILVRARAAGLVAAPGGQVVALAVHLQLPGSTRPGLSAVGDAAREAFGPALIAELDGDFLVAASVRAHALRQQLADFADLVERELRATVGLRAIQVAAGPLTADPAGLARSLPAAREALRLASRLAPGHRTVLASDLAVYHLLSSIVDDDQLQRFVEDQLGPLLEQDARHGTDLVLTLDAYLEAGLSKTAAAQALGIRRQTLYARLDRIVRLLGDVDFDTRQVRTALDLALVGWRMRSSAVTRR